MAKLTDAQLIVLSKAAQREDGAAHVPDRMNKAAAAKVGASLVARRLMREIRAKPGLPVWRIEEDGRRICLIITRAGRDAIGVADEMRQAHQPTEAPSAKRSSAAPKTGRPPNSNLPRSGSKQALLVAMLANDEGSPLTALVEATGWLPHTTRAAITGLRKRGFAIERTRDEKLGSLYRIIGGPTASVGA
jgi:DNA-binding MarR family transcriptional regulator